MMICGFMKTTSLTTLVAAAGILMGNLAYAPAKAADLGGGCCADLEERVAELEATTARKGNRVVSLQIYGQVNRAILGWDDGGKSDAYVVDNYTSGSRIGLIGKATMWAGWTAGYNIEFDYYDASSGLVSQPDNDNPATGGAGHGTGGLPASGTTNPSIPTVQAGLKVRYDNVYMESERLGRVTLGQQSTAADGINEIVLGNSLVNSSVYVGNSFKICLSNGVLSDRTFANFVAFASSSNTGTDGNRLDTIRYDLPELYGFILSADWGENDYADVALRFKREWNSIRMAAGIAYQWNDEARDTSVLRDETLSGSISIMHVPTGIYGAFAAGQVSSRQDTFGVDLDDTNFWYLQFGVERRFLPYGSTTFYGEYGVYDDFANQLLRSNNNLSGSTSSGMPNDNTGSHTGTDVANSEATRWGFGIVQKIDSAAMDVYAQYTNWSFDASPTTERQITDYQDFSTIMVGSRIKF